MAPCYHAAPHTEVVLPHSGDQAPREPGGASGVPSLTQGAYRALRALAARRLRGERVDHTLEPTALVHEAWIRMKDAPGDVPGPPGARAAEAPAQFRALAARMLRQILVDHARKRGALKRGGGARAADVGSLAVSSDGIDTDVLDLELALEGLAARDPRRAKVVELRFFGGLSAAEAARELGVSEDTVKRDWRLARAWLNRELGRQRGQA
jgi:RNA polymerase sigma factor (TIGR02999 family)